MKFPLQESSTLELKREEPKNEQIIKTIVGFCNQNGGKLVIGVNNDGTVVGIAEEDAQRMREYLEKSIYEATTPPIIPLVYTQRLDDKIVLFVEVSTGMSKPYYLKSEGLEKGVYVRLGRSTVRASAEMIEELRWQSRGREFEMMPVYHATQEDLDKKKINDFLKKRLRKQKVAADIAAVLSSYHVVVAEHAHQYPSVAGMLLFGKNTQHFFEHAMILCSHFAGNEGRQALASKECRGTIIEQFHEAYDFVESRLNRSFTIKGKLRKEELEIPEEALREVLINALVHRNYHIKAPIKIAIYQNRIEIYSPGCFPGPLNAQTLRMGFTFMRNVAICKIFRELGIIENMGTGFLTLFASYEKKGLQAPEVHEDANYVKCTLPRGLSAQEPKFQLVGDASGDMKGIRALFGIMPEISISDVVTKLGLARVTAGRRLAQLVADGVLEKKGAGKATRYKKVGG